MDRYVIRDTDNAEFVSAISHKGVETSLDIQKALIIDSLDKAKLLLEYIDFHNVEDYVIEEIEFKTVKESVEELED